MDRELQLKDLAPYLPYELTGYRVSKGRFACDDDVKEVVTWNKSDIDLFFSKRYHVRSCKPILRPLSDLTKEIEINGEKFVPIDFFEIGDGFNESPESDFGNIKLIQELHTISTHDCHEAIKMLPYFVIKKLHEWHFDTSGLIKAGLAIDINTINS